MKSKILKFKNKIISCEEFLKKYLMKNNMITNIIDIYKAYEMIIHILVIVIYKLLLDCIYVLVVHPVFYYMGFGLTYSLVKYLISFFTVLLFSFAIIGLYEKKSPSSIIVILLNLIYFIPMTTMYAFYGMSTVFYISVLVYWFIFMICQYKIPVLEIKKLTNDKFNKLMFYGLMFVFAIPILYVWARYAKFRIHFDILDVYGVRAEAVTYNIPVIIEYIRTMSIIATPIFFVYALENRKKLIAIFMIGLIFVNFFISAHKATLFMAFIVVAGYYVYKKFMIKLFAPVLVMLGAGSVVIWIALNNISLLSLFFRRVMFVANKLSYDYYLYFQENQLNIFRIGILGNLGFTAIYDNDIAKIIGVFIGDNNYANNGLLGDVFSNLGFVGIFIMPVILIIIFRLLDSVSHNLDHKILISICVYYTFSFSSTVWSTCLLTSGFLLTCILLYLFPIKKKESINYEV